MVYKKHHVNAQICNLGGLAREDLSVVPVRKGAVDVELVHPSEISELSCIHPRTVPCRRYFLRQLHGQQPNISISSYLDPSPSELLGYKLTKLSHVGPLDQMKARSPK